MDSAFCLIYGNKFSISPVVAGDGYMLCIFNFKRSTPSLPMSFLIENLIPPVTH